MCVDVRNRFADPRDLDLWNRTDLFLCGALDMIKSLVYYGNTPVGEVEVWPKGQTDLAWAREIRVDRLSPASERCPPLAVLHVVAAGARCLVMESKSTATAHEPPPPLVTMHTTCLKDNKVYIRIILDKENQPQAQSELMGQSNERIKPLNFYTFTSTSLA